MTLIYAYKDRGITRGITINDASGNSVTPETADILRAIIGREGETPKLTVTSETATDNGSSFTKGGVGEENLLRVDAQDLDFEPGAYSLTIDFFDNSDSQEWKMVDRQVFHLEGVE